MSRKSPMTNPFAPDATKAALRALTQPVLGTAPEPTPPPPATDDERTARLARLGPRTVVLSDADVLAAQEFGYVRGCRDLSAVLRAALDVLLKADEAGLIDVRFERKTSANGGRPIYSHQVALKEPNEQ